MGNRGVQMVPHYVGEVRWIYIRMVAVPEDKCPMSNLNLCDHFISLRGRFYPFCKYRGEPHSVTVCQEWIWLY